MLICDVMTRRVETVDPVESLQSAAARMRSCGIGVLPVLEEGVPVGMLTDETSPCEPPRWARIRRRPS
jgi:CBS domain-containing protein